MTFLLRVSGGLYWPNNKMQVFFWYSSLNLVHLYVQSGVELQVVGKVQLEFGHEGLTCSIRACRWTELALTHKMLPRQINHANPPPVSAGSLVSQYGCLIIKVFGKITAVPPSSNG